VKERKPKRIGIIADSHGNLEATAEAIRVLKGRGAALLVHLGDFCDSIRRESAPAMIDLLLQNGVLAVKGNNDFFVERRLSDARPTPDGEGVMKNDFDTYGSRSNKMLAFLRNTPVIRVRDGVRFAHSLPFDTLRAFYEPIDTGNTRRAEDLFAEADFRILFCGHSHLPILFRKADGRVTREEVPAGEPLALAPTARYIFVAGSAADGECGLYDEEAVTYERLRV
jgi:predicted phosphodiesterase